MGAKDTSRIPGVKRIAFRRHLVHAQMFLGFPRMLWYSHFCFNIGNVGNNSAGMQYFHPPLPTHTIKEKRNFLMGDIYISIFIFIFFEFLKFWEWNVNGHRPQLVKNPLIPTLLPTHGCCNVTITITASTLPIPP